MHSIVVLQQSVEKKINNSTHKNYECIALRNKNEPKRNNNGQKIYKFHLYYLVFLCVCAK